MIDIMFEKDDVILKFPKELIASEYVQKFLDRLRAETILQKSRLTEKQAFSLAEELKAAWWQKNKDAFLRGFES